MMGLRFNGSSKQLRRVGPIEKFWAVITIIAGPFSTVDSWSRWNLLNRPDQRGIRPSAQAGRETHVFTGKRTEIETWIDG